MHAADVDLVRRAGAGQRDAQQLFCVRMDCARHFLQSMVRRRQRRFVYDELGDLVQDVLLNVWRRLPSYAGAARLETWVYSFCWRTFQEAERRELRFARLSPGDEVVGAVPATSIGPSSATTTPITTSVPFEPTPR